MTRSYLTEPPDTLSLHGVRGEDRRLYRPPAITPWPARTSTRAALEARIRHDLRLVGPEHDDSGVKAALVVRLLPPGWQFVEGLRGRQRCRGYLLYEARSDPHDPRG